MKLVAFLFFCIGASLVPKTVGAMYYDMIYVQDECSPNRTIITPGENGRSLYGFVEATSSDCYENSKDCSVMLSARSGHHVTMRFQWMAIDCYYDYLNITGEKDSDTYCGGKAPLFSIYSSSNWVNLRFVTDSDTCAAGFRLYYTSYHYGECSENEFRCSIEGRCIPIELVCDSYDNCGDWSDEWSGTCGLTTGTVVAISVTCALMAIALIAFLFYCIHDRKHRHSSSSSSSSDSSSVVLRRPRNAVRQRRPSPLRPSPFTFGNHGGREEQGVSHGQSIMTEPLGFVQPIGPPKYADAPPAYTTTINGVYAGLYEDQDQIHPPPYHSTFTTAPYSSNNNNNNNQSLTCDNGRAGLGSGGDANRS